MNETRYRIYTIKDITHVFTGIRELAYSFAVISLCVILAAGAVTVFITRALLKPIATLKANTALIANGVYGNRVTIAERDEIGELGEDFNRMAEAVETHIQELRDEAERRTIFMSALTHELKTPMTGIKGNAQTLLATKLTEEEREDALYAKADAAYSASPKREYAPLPRPRSRAYCGCTGRVRRAASYTRFDA